MGFMIVGHTHTDIEAKFSLFARKLNASDAYTMKELFAVLQQSCEEQVECTQLLEMVDWKTAISPYLDNLISGHATPHLFRFYMEDDNPAMLYKAHCTDKNWGLEKGPVYWFKRSADKKWAGPEWGFEPRRESPNPASGDFTNGKAGLRVLVKTWKDAMNEWETQTIEERQLKTSKLRYWTERLTEFDNIEVEETGTVDIPEDEDGEVVKLRKELEVLKPQVAGGTNESRIEVLKETLHKKTGQESEEERLRQEIGELKSRQEKGKEKLDTRKEDEVLAMQLQIKELSMIRSELEEKNVELASLKVENSHLRKELRDLREEVLTRGKRIVGVVTESSPLEEPAKGKQKADLNSTTMYTDKDLEALQKNCKQFLVAKDTALKEAEMAKMGAFWIWLTARKTSMRKTIPRNLKTTFQAVEVGPDDNEEEEGQELWATKGNTQSIVEVAHDLGEAKMNRFRELGLKETRQSKKADMEVACDEKGITFIKLEQAKMDVFEIRVRRDYDV
ncbi:hypothetical protein CBR_g46602 [Chara braunii]|uniref:DUF7869 domain-containing protein n=1 Tax=Chara braunii TaxID=69332 RepID=A0A388M0V8_CHABU|nr:hypothetical protein CBR_g46602 [Chara braunii]|eukprot:GBG88113.1 hypothetical protein CBR_g46602 [Chara braunii]